MATLASALSLFVLGVGASDTPSSGSPREKVPVTIGDLIRFAVIGDPETIGYVQDDSYESGDNRNPTVAVSPHGKRVAVIVSRGNIASSTNNAELLVYQYRDLPAHPAPKTIAIVASSGNHAPISFVRWIDDDRLTFVATKDHAVSQVYESDLLTGSTVQLTHAKIQFDDVYWTQSADTIVTLDQVPNKPLGERQDCLSHGCRIAGEGNDPFGALVFAENGRYTGSYPISVFHRNSGRIVTVEPPEHTDDAIQSCSDPEFWGGLSPDGRYGVRECSLKQDHWPKWWKYYSGDPLLHRQDTTPVAGYVHRLEVTDFRTGRSRPLLSSPWLITHCLNSATEGFIWIDGGTRLLIVGAYEPLDIFDREEIERRESGPEILEVDPKNGATTPIAKLDRSLTCQSIKWTEASQTLEVGFIRKADHKPLAALAYRRIASGWVAAATDLRNALSVESTQSTGPVAVIVEQSLNDPPKLVAIDRRTGKKTILLDPNPWLADRKLGRVEAISWKSKTGHPYYGGLYYPADYIPGTRYPVVIQTHGFYPDRFSMTGLSKNFNARALAAGGIAVLQMDDTRGRGMSPEEVQEVQRGYEGAIDYLDKRGIIDRERVGIQAWSVTGPWIAYTLTHSSYHFAVSAFTSSGTGGLWFWMANRLFQGTAEREWGATPFGAGLHIWERSDPDLNLDRVNTPAIMWATGGPGDVGGLAGLWDWFTGLKRMSVPVEYWFFPDGEHSPYKVGDRMQAGSFLIDWYRYWLKDEKDTDPSKSEQYLRWDAMKRTWLKTRSVMIVH
jgi:hypothetical protein